MRASGILMPISSLPSPYGIGTMGAAARSFVDFLVKAGQAYWQILPVCPTSYGDSPYQSFSTFAGNPYFIDLDQLAADGLLKPEDYTKENWGTNPNYCDYALLYQKRYKVLRKAYAAFLQQRPVPGLLQRTVQQENERWQDGHTAQNSQHHALGHDNAQIPAHGIAHEAQGHKPGNGGDGAAGHRGNGPGNGLGHGRLMVFLGRQLLTITVPQENGVVHRHRQLQNSRRGEGLSLIHI